MSRVCVCERSWALTSRQCDNRKEMSELPVPALVLAAVPASSAKRKRSRSPAKRSKHKTDKSSKKETELIEPPQTSCAASKVEDHLSSLPPELQAIIIRNLDIKSIYNLYAAGYRGFQELVTECQFSVNSTLTAKSLKSNFIVSASEYFKELNLSGVPDLNLTTLLNALSNMNNLKNLDVSYTNVTMEDFLRIVEVRPKLKSIAINFIFYIFEDPIRDLWRERRKIEEPIRLISDDMVMTYQQAFARFENVHFVGDLQEHVLGGLAELFLEKANLFSLKYTVINDSETLTRYRTNLFAIEVTLTQFQMYYHKASSSEAFNLQIYTTMDIKKYEILLFVVRSDRSCEKIQDVYATPFLSKMICTGLGVQVTRLSESVSLSELQSKVVNRPDYYSSSMGRAGLTYFDTAVFFWDRERTDFDSAFSSKLQAIFKEHFEYSVNGTPAAAEGQWHSDSYRSDGNSCGAPVVLRCQPLLDLSHSRQLDVELDYGSAFKDKRDAKLRILFSNSFRPQTTLKLVNKCDFFKKLSHLCLCGNFNCDTDFFKDVFAQCESLTTLELMAVWFYDTKSLQYLNESKTLKNILISASNVDMRTLFAHLSECRTLENICLSFSEKLLCLPDPSDLLTQCVNLYSLYINLNDNSNVSRLVKNQHQAKMLKFYNSVMSDLGRDALTLVISTKRKVQYHTHLGVFKFFNSLVPMKF